MIHSCRTPEEFKKARRGLLKLDPALKPLLRQYRDFEFKPHLQRSPFESLVRAIAHQQLHGKAAETILGRMLALFPQTSFPSPEELWTLAPEALRGCGFSASKAKSIQDIAAKAISGVVPTTKGITKLGNMEIVDRLTAIYGVGQWTVEMMLIFQLGRMDVWPVDDFGVRRGYQIWTRKREMPTPKDLRKVGERWAPYQTLMALYMWQVANAWSAKRKAKG